MKINMLKLLIVALIVSTAVAGCKDERDNYMVDDTISFVDAELYKSVSVYNEEYQFAVLKNGKGRSGATAILTPSKTALEAYNTANGTNLALLPENCYKLSATAIGFGEQDTRKFVDVTWDDAAIFGLGDGKEYAIALELSADNDALVVDENRKVIIINPKRTSVGMVSTLGEAASPAASREVIASEYSIALSDPIAKMDVTVNYAIDNTLVAAYNQANGTDYKAAPDGLVTLASGSSLIKAGEKETTFACQINSATLFNGNELKAADENKYLVPVRITTLSVDGIDITNGVMYVPVVMNMELKGPWTLLEGENNCYAKDPQAPGWASGYTADKLFDGETTQNHEWISWFNTQIQFPVSFVVDLGVTRVFTKFLISDYTTHQGNYLDYELYTAEEYTGSSTKWTLVASGMRDYKGWTGKVETYDYPVQKMAAGRYLKFVIVKPQSSVGDFLYGRGKLADVQGMGF